jgi:uncharacterized protein (TIRG00374 family)
MIGRLRAALPWLAGATGIVLVWLAASSVSLADAWRSLRQLQLAQLAILIGLNGLVLVMMNARWWLILRLQGYPLSFWRLMGARLAGFSVSYFTPGMQFGGEPVQVFWLQARADVPRATATAAITLDKTIELLVSLSFLLGAMLLIVPGRLGDAITSSMLLVTLGLLLLPSLYLAAVWRRQRPLSAIWRRIPASLSLRWPYLGAALNAVETQIGQTCRQAPRTLTFILFVSVTAFATMILEFGAMMRFLGLPAGVSDILTAFALLRLGLLAPTPGGLGGVEASQMLAFSALGYNPVIAVSLLLLIRVRDLCLGLSGMAIGGRLLGLGRRSQRA